MCLGVFCQRLRVANPLGTLVYWYTGTGFHRYKGKQVQLVQRNNWYTGTVLHCYTVCHCGKGTRKKDRVDPRDGWILNTSNIQLKEFHSLVILLLCRLTLMVVTKVMIWNVISWKDYTQSYIYIYVSRSTWKDTVGKCQTMTMVIRYEVQGMKWDTGRAAVHILT